MKQWGRESEVDAEAAALLVQGGTTYEFGQRQEEFATASSLSSLDALLTPTNGTDMRCRCSGGVLSASRVECRMMLCSAEPLDRSG